MKKKIKWVIPGLKAMNIFKKSKKKASLQCESGSGDASDCWDGAAAGGGFGCMAGASGEEMGY